MPARRRRTAAPVDDIEDVDATQKAEEEDVEMDGEGEEEEQPRRGKKLARARKTLDIDDFDPNNFPDYPIAAQEAVKLQSMAQDWGQMSSLINQTAFTLLNEVAAAVAETADQGDSKELESLDKLMKELIGVDEDLKQQQQCLIELHEKAAEEDLTDILGQHKQLVEAKAEQWEKKTARQKYVKNKAYFEFRQMSHEVLHPEIGMPPLVELIPAEEGDGSDDDDDDIQVGGVVKDLKCPITLTLMVEPYTSEVCNHSYSKAAIWDFLGQNASVYSKKPCPACNRMICKKDLYFDKDLEAKIKRQMRRQQREDDSDEAEEIIE
ncbi:hypothetical protein PENSPDRAFT_659116 [Peniophora sp. CONT]|nr:hypothetical protein PENSPDRAFT_659116 [Peniophora sp. CONT]